MYTATDFIHHYQLLPHPEGGYYKEIYRAKESISKDDLPTRYGGTRNFSTAIYFLLEQNKFSAFHRIKSDECWHFYAGGTLLIHMIDEEGKVITTRLGNDIFNGEVFQFVVPAGNWFAAETAAGVAFSFVGCTVSPGFDFEDFEIANRNELSIMYPQQPELTQRLTI